MPSLTLHSLPPDLLHIILSHLPPFSLLSLSSTCTTYRALCLEDSLWQRFAPAPLGKAYRTYLINRAWKAARAVTHTIPVDTPIAAIYPHASTLILSCLHPVPPHPNLCLISPVYTAKTTTIRHDPHSGYIYVAYGAQDGRATLYQLEPPTFQPVCIVDTHFHATLNGVDIITNPPTLLAALSTGCFAYTSSEQSPQNILISQWSLRAIAVKGDTIAVGTFGGEVITTTLRNTSIRRYYIGSCSCAISALQFTATALVAGYAHRNPGSGHRSAAVAWHLKTGSRIPFGREAFSRASSAASLMASVRTICAFGDRVALIAGSRVYVYGDWQCDMEMEAEDGLGLDGERLFVTGKGVRVLDFGAAIGMWPGDVQIVTNGGG